MDLPIQENLVPPHDGEKPVGSIAATLAFVATQEGARNVGRPNWRDLPDDGSQPRMGPNSLGVAWFMLLLVCPPRLRKLPGNGVRWLYLRTEAKRIQGGRVDFEVLVFDERMDLVAVSSQVAQIIRGVDKTQRGSSL